MKRALGALTLALALAGCKAYPDPLVVGVKPAPADATWKGMPLRSGQLVLTESMDASSLVFTLVAKEFHPFTHVAILAMEEGEPFVYDVTGEMAKVPTYKNPMDNVTGVVTKTPLTDYVGPNLYAEIYDPPEGANGERIVAFAKKKHEDHVKFDAKFDFVDHERLFCTELVELAIRDGGGPHHEPEAASENPTVVRSMEWLGISPKAGVLPAGVYADEKRWVASYGRLRNRSAAWSYFEAKRELHRRFTADQRLGFLVAIDGSGRLSVRAPITDFTTKAQRLFDGDPSPPAPRDARIHAAVTKLANETFGPF